VEFVLGSQNLLQNWKTRLAEHAVAYSQINENLAEPGFLKLPNTPIAFRLLPHSRTDYGLSTHFPLKISYTLSTHNHLF
jgi:hypothetical protein